MVGAPPRLPDQHVLNHRIIVSYGLIAPLVTMSCRLLLRRVASRGVLPRERFSPVTLSGPRAPAGSDASWIGIPVRGDVVDLAPRNPDIHQLPIT